MSRGVQAALAALLAFVLVAFCRWEINPGDWGSGGRLFACYLAAVFATFTALAPRPRP